MRLRFPTIIAALVLAATSAAATELVMVEQQGCAWCEKWDEEIAPIYPKTTESAVAPLRRMDISSDELAKLNLSMPVSYTPTFILLDGGVEKGRIEGYPGEDFFWGLLDALLEKHTEYERNS